MTRKRYRPGCIWRRGDVWYIRFGKGDAVRLGTTKELPTKVKVRQAAEPLIFKANSSDDLPIVTMAKVIAKYKLTAMPRRSSTSATYSSWINNHIEPKWGSVDLSDFGKPPEIVQDWLRSLPVSTKSKREVRNILSQLLKNAVLWGWIKNPPNLGTIRLAKTKGEKVTKARALPIAEFKLMVAHLEEPFRTMAYVCYFHGLRVSELFGLKWRDVNWLEKQLELRQAVVAQVEDDTKTPASEATHPLQDEELEMLKDWRQASEFTEPEHYIFASPYKAGEKPYSYSGFKAILQRACKAAGIQLITTHSFRHAFRSQLSANGVAPDMVKTLMRHSTLEQSFQYGSSVPDNVRQAHRKLVSSALSIT
jgi:integrase